MQKYDDMKSGISVRTGLEDEFSKNKHVLFFVNIHVLNELECSGGSLFSSGVPGGSFSPEQCRIVSLAISRTSSMQSRPIITNES